MKNETNPLSLIKGNIGAAQWRLLQQSVGVDDECDDPSKATLALEEIKAEGLVDDHAGELPLSGYQAIYGTYLNKLSGDKYQPETVEGRLRHLDSVKSYWPDYSAVPTSKLAPEHLQNMRPTMRRNMATANGQQPSKNSLNTYCRAVSYLISFLVGFGVLGLDRALLLMRSIGYAKPTKRKIPTCTVEHEETMRRYLTETWWHTSYSRAQIVIVYEIFMTYGIREEMFSTLMVEQVDLPNRQITFTLNKQSCDEIKTRTVLIPESLAAKLAEFIKRHNLLPGQRLVTVGSIDRSLKTAARKAGLPNWHPHACRHYVGQKLMRARVPIPVVAWLLGHKDGGITLLLHYAPDDFTADANQALEQQDLRNHFDVEEEFWFARQLPLLIDFVKRLEFVPKVTAKSIIQHMHQMDRYVQSREFAKALALAGAAQDPQNPLNCTPKTIYIPKTYSTHAKNVLANNLRTLMTRAGLNAHSLIETLNLGRDSLYAVLRGEVMNEQVLAKLAAYFKLTRSQLADSGMPEIDWDRVFKNVQILMDRYGVPEIPCSAQLGRFINGREIPSGSALKALADFAEVEFAKILDVDLGENPDLIKRPLPEPKPSRAEKAFDYALLKENFKANLKVQLLVKGVTLVEAAVGTGIRLNQLYAYSCGENLPPDDRLECLAKYFGTTSAEMTAMPVKIDVASVTGNISRLLNAKQLPLWKAAKQIGIGITKLQPIIAGQEIPNGPQLHRIAAYLETTPKSLLGIDASTQSARPAAEVPAAHSLPVVHVADAKIAA